MSANDGSWSAYLQKRWTDDSSVITVAQVGATGTDADRDRFLAAKLWLSHTDPEFYSHLRSAASSGRLYQDYIDLHAEAPRDFLAEQRLYDIVITNNLWGYPELFPNRTCAATACSPLHAPSAWRRRLQDSGACYIFLFGPDFNGSYLDFSMSGYTCVQVPLASYLSVFVTQHRSQVPQGPAIGYRELNRVRLAHLSELLTNRTLDLSFTELAAKHLRQITMMSTLIDLRLVGTALSDADLPLLGAIPTLRHLNLDYTRIGSAGLGPLARLQQLESLSLNYTEVADDGLAQIQDLPQLEWLSVVGTAVSDRSMVNLARMKGLQTLVLVKTLVSAPAVADLQRALPACAIIQFLA